MTIVFENPYAKPLHDKYREEATIPSTETERLEKIKAEIEELRKKQYDFTRQKLDEGYEALSKVEVIKDEIGAMPKETPKDIKNLLKKCADGYKKSVELYHFFREVRKTVKGKDDGGDEPQ
jgi:hypothetical protein